MTRLSVGIVVDIRNVVVRNDQVSDAHVPIARANFRRVEERQSLSSFCRSRSVVRVVTGTRGPSWWKLPVVGRSTMRALQMELHTIDTPSWSPSLPPTDGEKVE